MSSFWDDIILGHEVANPAYNSKTKAGRAQPKTVISHTPQVSIADQIANEVVKTDALIRERNYELEKNKVLTEQAIQDEKYKNQSNLSRFGNMLMQGVVGEAILGTIRAFFDLGDLLSNNIGLSLLEDRIRGIKNTSYSDYSLFGNGSRANNYTNPISSLVEKGQNALREHFEITERNPGKAFAFNDFGWWMNGLVSLWSTLSIMIPGLGVAGGVSKLARATKFLPQVSRWTATVIKAPKQILKPSTELMREATGLMGKLNAVEGVGAIESFINNTAESAVTSFFSRTIEDYQEARQTYNDVKEYALNQLTDELTAEDWAELYKNNPEFEGLTNEEIADIIAGRSAHDVFNDDYWMMLSDFFQAKGILSVFSKKTASREALAATRLLNKEAGKQLVGDELGKISFWNIQKESLKQTIKNPLKSLSVLELGEGFEEMFQYVQQEQGMDMAMKIFDPEYHERTLISYLEDPMMWDQGLWGSFGGVVYMKGSRALRQGAHRYTIYKDYKAGKISEDDYQLLKLTDEKIRADEISKRVATLQAFTNDMNLLNAYYNPYSPITDKNGNPVRDNDGSQLYNPIDPEVVDAFKEILVADYATQLGMHAAQVGNGDLLLEYLKSPYLKQYLQQQGLETTAGENALSEDIIRTVERAVNVYQDALYNLTHLVNITNPYIIGLVAADITSNKLKADRFKDYRNRKGEEWRSMSDDLENDEVYARWKKAQYVSEELTKLHDELQLKYQQLLNNEISKRAYDLYVKDYNNKAKILQDLVKNDPYIQSYIEEQRGKDERTQEELDNRLPHEVIREYADLLNSAYKTSRIGKIWNPDNSGKTINTPKDAVRNAIESEIELDHLAAYHDSKSMKSRNDYKELYDHFEETHGFLTKMRLIKAVENVNKWLDTQDDLDDAFDALLNETSEVEKLKSDLQLLKLGYGTTAEYLKAIQEHKEYLENQRLQEEINSKNTQINGQPASSATQSQNINEEATNSNKNTTESKESLEQRQADVADKINTLQEKQKTDRLTEDEVDELDALRNELAEINKKLDDLEQQKKIDEATKKELEREAKEEEEIRKQNEKAQKEASSLFEKLGLNEENSSPEVRYALQKAKAFDLIAKYFQASENKTKMEILIADNNPTESDIYRQLIAELSEQLRNNGLDIKDAEIFIEKALAEFVTLLADTSRNPNKKSSLKSLANKIAHRIDVTNTNGKLAVTNAVTDEQLNEIVSNFLIRWSNGELDNGKNTTIRKRKGLIVINLEKLFYDLLFNENLGLSEEEVSYILQNIGIYLLAPNIKQDERNKFFFYGKRKLLEYLYNPMAYLNYVKENRKQYTADNYETLNDHMHIKSPTKLTDEYFATIEQIKNGDPLTFELVKSNDGKIVSISVQCNGVEIGYLGAVSMSKDGNEFSLANQTKGFIWKYKKSGDTITSNLDELISDIISNLPEINNQNNASKDLKQLAELISNYNLQRKLNEEIDNLQHLRNQTNELFKLQAALREVETKVKAGLNGLMSNSIVQKLISDGNYKVEPKTSNYDIAKNIISSLTNIIYFDKYATNSYLAYNASYQLWKLKQFNNFRDTYKIQDLLSQGKAVQAKLSGLSNQKLLYDSENENDINNLGFTAESNPVIGVALDKNNQFVTERRTDNGEQEQFPNKVNFGPGSMGILVDSANGSPMIAVFTSENYLVDGKGNPRTEFAKAVYNEIMSILDRYIRGDIDYNGMKGRLNELYGYINGQVRSLLKGYNIIDTGNSICINIAGTKNYNVIISKENSKNGTRRSIEYRVNGTAKTSTIVTSGTNKENTKRALKLIADEMIKNTRYNMSYIGLLNKNINGEYYISYIDNKLTIHIGSYVAPYNNYTEFVLGENAFKTNQQQTARGGYFDTSENSKSAYIDVSTIEESKSEKKIKKTTTTDNVVQYIKDQEIDYKDKKKPVTGSFKRLFDIVSEIHPTWFTQHELDLLFGNNEYSIPLIEDAFGYTRRGGNMRLSYANGNIYVHSITGINALLNSKLNLLRLPLHESLHKKLAESENNPMLHKEVINGILDIYNQMIDAITSDLSKSSKVSKERKQRAKDILDWINKSQFRPNDYYKTISDKAVREAQEKNEEKRLSTFAEEFLVESLTQQPIMEYLNDVATKTEEKVSDIKNKSLWQKLIDLLAKLFGVKVKDNTLLAREYRLLAQPTNDNIKPVGPNIEEVQSETTEETESTETESEEEELDEEYTELSDEDESDIDVFAPDTKYATTEEVGIEQTATEINMSSFAKDTQMNQNRLSIITSMDDYVRQFLPQDQENIQQMINQNEINFVCF